MASKKSTNQPKQPQQKPLECLSDKYNELGSQFRQMIDAEALSLPMCVHLSRETLKQFLLQEAREEDVERAQDSILGKWAQIAKKAQTWLADESVGLFPKLLDDHLFAPLRV